MIVVDCAKFIYSLLSIGIYFIPLFIFYFSISEGAVRIRSLRVSPVNSAFQGEPLFTCSVSQYSERKSMRSSDEDSSSVTQVCTLLNAKTEDHICNVAVLSDSY